MSVPNMVLNFWEYQRSQGRKPTPVYAVRAGEGHEQPRGYVLGWSVSRAAVLRHADKISNQGATYIERLMP